MGNNALKAIEKDLSGWGHDRRRLGSHPDDDSAIRQKELRRLVQGASFGAGLQLGRRQCHAAQPDLGRDRGHRRGQAISGPPAWRDVC